MPIIANDETQEDLICVGRAQTEPDLIFVEVKGHRVELSKKEALALAVMISAEVAYFTHREEE